VTAVDAETAQERAARLARLSRLAAGKLRLIQWAEAALGVAVLLVLAAAVA
jgi:hypothetical protein